MLMFIFGAGASFDSDPRRRPGDIHNEFGEHFRPPLATDLFTPPSDVGQQVVAEFPRAAPVIMQLRQAVAQGRDVEEVLEGISAGETAYPATARQLLAFRGYLARLLRVVPQAWADDCQGLTNYVLALSAADRWNTEASHTEGREAISCVTFNYDTLLEEAVDRAFGHRIDSLDDFISSEDIHVYKPHGSVSWRQAARWRNPLGLWLDDDAGFYQAMDQATVLAWLDEWSFVANPELERLHDPGMREKIWLPALSIPVRRKSDFTMPTSHRDALTRDLGRVTTVIAVGWRARERHFLKLIQDYMPSQPARLVVVAEDDRAARETIDNLWKTGRFQAYAISGVGFSGFTDPPGDQPERPWISDSFRTALTLTEVLTSDWESLNWTRRDPGSGFPNISVETGDYVSRPYADL